jgi:hypothetical protein
MKISLAGRRAPEDMPAGNYIARCIHFEEKRRGRNHFVILTFIVLQPVRYADVALLRWLPIAENLSPLSVYARSWEVAAGKQATDDLPPEIFLGKVFRIRVGFRSNDQGKFDAELTSQRKDEKDFLRVHEILALADSRIAHRASDIGHSTKTKTIAVAVGGGGLNINNDKSNSNQGVSAPKRDMGERDTTSGKAGKQSDSSPSPDGRGATVEEVLQIFGGRIVDQRGGR